jgi:hypothetical protein
MIDEVLSFAGHRSLFPALLAIVSLSYLTVVSTPVAAKTVQVLIRAVQGMLQLRN